MTMRMDKSISQYVFSLVDNLPDEHVQHIAALLEKETSIDWDRLDYIMKTAVPAINAQNRVHQFLLSWQSITSPPPPREMAQLIRSVAFALDKQREKQVLELIWTGPKTPNNNLRRTDQALLELINTANDKITIVSFAVYKAKKILSALEKAALRGVEITVVLESHDSSEGKIAYDTIAALGASLRAKAKIFIWPFAKRPTTSQGKVGSLHAKCAVADGKRLYISSANLTDYAMNVNMELGILMEGKSMASRIEKLFQDLIDDGTLSEIASS